MIFLAQPRWFYGVMVSTLDFESSDPSSNLGRTWVLVPCTFFPMFRCNIRRLQACSLLSSNNKFKWEQVPSKFAHIILLPNELQAWISFEAITTKRFIWFLTKNLTLSLPALRWVITTYLRTAITWKRIK